MMRGGGTNTPKTPFVEPPPSQSAAVENMARRLPAAGAAQIAGPRNLERMAVHSIDMATPQTRRDTSGWSRQHGCTCRIWVAATVNYSSAGINQVEAVPKSDGCMPAAAPRPMVPPLRKFVGAMRRLGSAHVEASLGVQAQFGGVQLRLGRLAEEEGPAARSHRRPLRQPGCERQEWQGTSPTLLKGPPRRDARRLQVLDQG